MQEQDIEELWRTGRHLATTHRAEFSLIADCLYLQDSLAADINARNIPRDNLTLYQAILATNLMKATNSLKAVALLATDGKIEDSRTLVRKLLELAINMRHLAQDPDGHTNLYAHHQAVRRYFRALRYTKSKEQPDDIKVPLKQALPRLRAEYEDALQYFPKDKKGEILWEYRNNWSGLSVQMMAERTGLAEHYQEYDLSSVSTHSSIEDFDTYFDFENFRFVEGFDPSAVRAVVLEAAQMHLSIIGLVATAYDIDLAERLSTIRDTALSLGAKPV